MSEVSESLFLFVVSSEINVCVALGIIYVQVVAGVGVSVRGCGCVYGRVCVGVGAILWVL